MVLKRIVPKRIDAPNRSGRSRNWIEVKNPNCPAMTRARDGFESRSPGSPVCHSRAGFEKCLGAVNG
jgi:hypothetical protein